MTKGVERVDEAKRDPVRAAGAMLRDKADVWDNPPWKMIVRDKRDEIAVTFTLRSRCWA